MPHRAQGSDRWLRRWYVLRITYYVSLLGVSRGEMDVCDTRSDTLREIVAQSGNSEYVIRDT
jgi:hypothetical protein